MKITSSYDPSKEERLALGQTLLTPGWKVIEKIVVAAQAEFRDAVFLLNPFQADHEKRIIEASRQANVAVKLWEQIARRIEKADLKTEKPKGTRPTPEDAIEDVTENL